jgi:hypothetical protein
MMLGSQDLPLDRLPTESELVALVLAQAQLPVAELLATEGGRIFDTSQIVLPGCGESSFRFELAPCDVLEELRLVLADQGVPAGGGFEAGQTFTHRLSVRRMRGVINTSYHHLPKNRVRNPYNAAFLNPADMTELGLSEGDAIEISSKHGRIPAIVKADGALRPKVVSMSHGWGGLPGEPDDYQNTGASTSLLIDSQTDLETINGMARLSAIPVNISPVAHIEN